ncbi:MAG: 1-acyl-sn-glycerol-3-phosphate acyltransferase [Clostridia bacterium]|nr:1-acyl-sn-glycerol-3-phosphate acyltransferase [Clostridia bacterium]
MLRTIGMLLYVAGYLILNLPSLLKAKLLEKDPVKHEAYCRKKIVGFCRRCIKVMGMKLEMRGLENIPDHATLTVYNHQSLLDAFPLIAHMPNTQSMVAKKELEKAPGISDWMKAGHCIFIDRSSPRAGMLCINQGAELLANNINVTIAPEGTRNYGGEIAEFKGGAFKMATKAEAPILPVAIEGTYKLFEGNGKKLRSDRVILSVLPPIPTKGLSREEQKELPEKVRKLIETEVNKLKGELNS